MDQKAFAEIQRVEDKYIIDRDKLPKIEAKVKKHLDPSYPDKNVKFTFIKSTYFDTPTLQLYRAHLRQDNTRFKIRMRMYGPNGVWDTDHVYLEIKEKNDGDVNKSRIELDKYNQLQVQLGKALKITPDLLAMNKKLMTKGDIDKFLYKVNYFITTFKLKPMVMVMYRRTAYQTGPDRVTLDTGLTYKPVGNISMVNAVKLSDLIDWKMAKKYGDKYQRQEDAIMEIKYDEFVAKWLDDMLKDMKLDNEKMSKYAWAMYRMLYSLLRK